MTIPAVVRREVLRAGQCTYCADGFVPMTVDHIVPISRGGTDSRSNLTAACWRCNFEKLDFTPDEWKAWREEKGLPWPPQRRSAQLMEIFQQFADNIT